MKRREFLKTTAAVGIAALTVEDLAAAMRSGGVTTVESSPDLVAVMGGEPKQLLDRALQELGGIGRYVKRGQSVLIKPNIGWDKSPEMAADTNPELVGALVEQCFSAGAKRVSVFDHTCDNWQKCYVSSGIRAAAEAAGAVVVPGNDESYYREVAIDGAVELKSVKIHRLLFESDVWFNVPVLKNHGGAKMSIAMKNYMGIVWDRGFFHSHDLQQCIADICLFDRKPVLNIIDAYRCMTRNGPQGRSVSDAVTLKALIASTDIVAADTAAVGLFNQVKEMDIREVGHIANGERMRIGTKDLGKLNIKRVKL
ncbi:MAG: DUF362 domain-containing protein [Dysgonamonadaceae bacterium]|jgi:uncharacterized protein (DUF362 family)|nr:DUF362 domain-containing protein [Dysgonamonadaceae bacterium]